jgi:hypothetical protein
LVAVLVALSSASPRAHDIPADITVHMFVKLEGNRLRLLVRVPLDSINDVSFPARAGNGEMLDLARAEPALRESATRSIADHIDFYENERLLASPELRDVRASLQGDQSFMSYDTALAHVTGPPLPDDTVFVLNQGMLDASFEYPIQSDRSRFAFDADFGHLGHRVVTVLRFMPPGKPVRAYNYEGNRGLVQLDPRWHQAAWSFVKSGFSHILDGTDHLLFLFCLVIPFRRFRTLVPVVTGFTVAHSITLIASAYDMAPGGLWFPPFIETLIAASIVYMALENIVSPQPRRRWMMAFGFGLVHGFGFSFALRETLQFAGGHLLTSLLAFNVGVEIGQIAVLALMVPAIALLFRYAMPERIGSIILSALAAHTAWHWMSERYGQLSRFPITMPVIDAAFLATAMWWAMLVVAAAGLAWFVSVLRQSRRRDDTRFST